MPNMLVIHTLQELAQLLDRDRLMQDLKTRVEKKDPAFYEMCRYLNPAAFYKYFLHLSGILLWTTPAQLWINKQARPSLDEKVLRLVSSLSATASSA